MMHRLHLLVTPRLSTRGPMLSRLFTTKKRPDWMVEAELDAIAATNARAAKQGTANNITMSKLQHDLDSERVPNAIKLEDKLVAIIKKCKEATASATDAHGCMVYNTLQKKALQTRQDLITQKEAAGMALDATSIVENAYPIPASK
jgi:hypothetical protein